MYRATANRMKIKGPNLDHLMSKLRIKIEHKHRRLSQPDGPEGRLKILRKIVNGVIKYERLELPYSSGGEARGYVERLIADAIKYGDQHQETMEKADYWLEEKQLIHKLFKVLVPRFVDCPTAYTNLYKAPLRYPQTWKARTVLELKGNPYPPLVFNGARNKNLIHNVLLEEARKEHKKKKYTEVAEKVRLSEEEQKNTTKNSEDNEHITKAAQDVSESEELLKCKPTKANKLSEELKPNEEHNPIPAV